MKGLRLVLATFMSGAAACSLPIAGFSNEQDAAKALDATLAPPIVQVRDYPHSSEVAVVAWEPDDAQIGLRTSIARSGFNAAGTSRQLRGDILPRCRTPMERVAAAGTDHGLSAEGGFGGGVTSLTGSQHMGIELFRSSSVSSFSPWHSHYRRDRKAQGADLYGCFG